MENSTFVGDTPIWIPAPVLTMNHPVLPSFVQSLLRTRPSVPRCERVPTASLPQTPLDSSCDMFIGWLVCSEHVAESPARSVKQITERPPELLIQEVPGMRLENLHLRQDPRCC